MDIRERVNRLMKDMKESESIEHFLDEMRDDLVAKFIVVMQILESSSDDIETTIHRLMDVVYPVSLRTFEENISALVDSLVVGEDKDYVKPALMFQVVSKITVDYIDSLSYKIREMKADEDKDDNTGYA